MYADLLILVAIREHPRHGYEIKKVLEQSMQGAFPLVNSVLYPALRRLEEMGALQREVVHQEGKPDRHIYTRTDRSEEILHSLLCDFPAEVASNDTEFRVRTAFFDLLEPEERITILETRASTLRKQISKHIALAQSQQLIRDQPLPFIQRMLSFYQQQVQEELYWIETLLQEQRQLL